MPSNPEQFLYLTTRGRKTGQPREIEIWFTSLDGRYYIVAEYATSQWVQNIKANQDVRARVQDRSFHARARLLSAQSDADLCRRIEQLSREKYGWGEGQIVELLPLPEAGR